MKRAHAAIFLLFVVDKLIFFFLNGVWWDSQFGFRTWEIQNENQETSPKKKKNAFYLLWAYYNLSTFGLAEIYVAYL